MNKKERKMNKKTNLKQIKKKRRKPLETIIKSIFVFSERNHRKYDASMKSVSDIIDSKF